MFKLDYFPGELSQAQICASAKNPFPNRAEFNHLSLMWIQLYTQVHLSQCKLRSSPKYYICMLKGCPCGYKLCENIEVKEAKALFLHGHQNASHNSLGRLQIQIPLDFLVVVVWIYWILLLKLLSSLFLCISYLDIVFLFGFCFVAALSCLMAGCLSYELIFHPLTLILYTA